MSSSSPGSTGEPVRRRHRQTGRRHVTTGRSVKIPLSARQGQGSAATRCGVTSCGLMTREPVIGVVFRPQSPPERLRDAVVAADQAGVPELWLWEDCFFQGGLSMAAAALAWSERIHVGVGLLPVPLRNPALVAMEVATIARLFPGRFTVALGHGVPDWMAQVGAAVASPMTLLREHTTAVHGLLRGHTVDAAGQFVQLAEVSLDWPPQQIPQLLIGARGPKTIRLAGEITDGVLIDQGGAVGVGLASRLVAEGRAASGRGGNARIVAYTELDPTASALAQQIANRVGELAEAGADSVMLHSTAEHPDPEALIAALCSQREPEPS